MNRRLMFVHAHPDDESSKGAATAARYVDEGAEVVLVTLHRRRGRRGAQPQRGGGRARGDGRDAGA